MTKWVAHWAKEATGASQSISCSLVNDWSRGLDDFRGVNDGKEKREIWTLGSIKPLRKQPFL